MIFTKKKVAIVSILGTVVLVLALFSREIGLCDNALCSSLSDSLSGIFLIFVPLLIMTGINIFVREDVFQSWRRFAVWSVPLSIWMVYISSDQGGILSSPSTREVLMIFLPLLFLV